LKKKEKRKKRRRREAKEEERMVGVVPGGAPATGAHQLAGGKAFFLRGWKKNRERERGGERETVRERYA